MLVKRKRLPTRIILLGLLLAVAMPLAVAAPFDPSVLKVSVDDSLWQRLHIGPEEPLNSDTLKLYRIKKAEVAVFTGDREFAVHTFTPQDAKPYKFLIPHGVPHLKIRLKTWTTDDLVWTRFADQKELGNDIVVRAVPAATAVYSPGF
jgi:hypothetical protein